MAIQQVLSAEPPVTPEDQEKYDQLLANTIALYGNIEGVEPAEDGTLKTQTSNIRDAYTRTLTNKVQSYNGMEGVDPIQLTYYDVQQRTKTIHRLFSHTRALVCVCVQWNTVGCRSPRCEPHRAGPPAVLFGVGTWIDFRDKMAEIFEGADIQRFTEYLLNETLPWYCVLCTAYRVQGSSPPISLEVAIGFRREDVRDFHREQLVAADIIHGVAHNEVQRAALHDFVTALQYACHIGFCPGHQKKKNHRRPAHWNMCCVATGGAVPRSPIGEYHVKRQLDRTIERYAPKAGGTPTPKAWAFTRTVLTSVAWHIDTLRLMLHTPLDAIVERLVDPNAVLSPDDVATHIRTMAYHRSAERTDPHIQAFAQRIRRRSAQDDDTVLLAEVRRFLGDYDERRYQQETQMQAFRRRTVRLVPVERVTSSRTR